MKILKPTYRELSEDEIKDIIEQFANVGFCIKYSDGRIFDVKRNKNGDVEQILHEPIFEFDDYEELEKYLPILNKITFDESKLDGYYTGEYWFPKKHTIVEPIFDGTQTIVCQYKVVQTGNFPTTLFIGSYDECWAWKNKNS